MAKKLKFKTLEAENRWLRLQLKLILEGIQNGLFDNPDEMPKDVAVLLEAV